jgi:flagellar biosynthesis protein FliR
MTLIEDWDKKIHKLWSVRLAAVTAFLSALQLALPHIIAVLSNDDMFSALSSLLPYLTDYLTPDTISALSSFFAIAAIVARVIAQPALDTLAAPPADKA